MHRCSIVIVALLTTAGAVAGQAETAENVLPTIAPSHGQTTGAEVLPGDTGFRDGSLHEPRWIPPHPPFSEIPPAPMPVGRAPGEHAPSTVVPAQGGVIMYDAETGETVEMRSALPADFPSPGRRPGYYPGVDAFAEDRAKGFGTMSEVADSARDDFPWRANVKMVMRFEDTSGNSHFFNCSGTMADAEVVLTAAHCIYQHDPDGIQIWDWAREVWVYPGWLGTGAQWGDPGSSVIEPYGYGRGTSYMAGGNFIDLSDPDNADVGTVRITRAVGMLTSWFGGAWDHGCDDWMTVRTASNASFPGEGCGTPGLHTGRDMYYWSGSVDYCDVSDATNHNQLFIWTTPGCFTAGWGGMSGSSVYYFHDDSSRYMHAVTSRSDRATWTSYARIWGTYANDMYNTFVPDTRGSSFDLQALAVNGPSQVTAGTGISGSSFFATNPTNADVASSAYTYRTYLSTNTDISTFDTLLSTQSFTWDFNAMSSVTVNMGSSSVPLDTPSGDYYFGVILDNGTDAVSGNNDTNNWDALAIEVLGIVDPYAVSVNAPSGTFDHGESINVSFTVTNQGGDPSQSVSVKLYASTNTIISTFDTEIFANVYSGLDGNESVSDTRSITIPASLTPDDYYIGMIITVGNDDVPGNNDTYDATPLTVTDPNLIFADGFEDGDAIWP